jgi:arylsulfatase A-like enzyme
MSNTEGISGMKDVLRRRDFLKAVGAATVCGSMGANASAAAAHETAAQPNVVLVMTDDQGYGDLGCHGNTEIKTPNLDKLHAESVRLTNFHVGPTCSPTRAALSTGVWHTVMGRSLLRTDEVTMADVFAASGYRTGIFGKWHLGDNYPFRPQDRGFSEVLTHGGGGIGQTPDYWGNDYFDDTYLHNGERENFTGYCTDVWFEGAMKFIEANKDRPFFCYVPTNAPHAPYYVADKYSKPYRDKGIEEGRAAFYGMVTNIDDNLGRLMQQLKDLDLERDTILIFMTDNGTSGGHRIVNGIERGYNCQMRGRKGSEYDGGHRVPCFIRWPGGGLSGARDIGQLTAHIDLLPTLIDLCELRKPAVEFDGESLTALLTNRIEKWRDRAVVTDSQRIEDPQKWRKSAVMTDRWRLINGTELYDMKVDPGQNNDISAENRRIVARLREVYEDWWAETSKRFGEYCEIILGSDKENPSTLTCHDWHSIEGVRQAHSSQRAVRDGAQTSGFWAVEIARDGVYEFALRRWPAEVDKPINAATWGGKAIGATTARLKIADVDTTQPVSPGARAVRFEVKLKAGKTRLQTWFTNKRGESWGAYYLYVKRS